jgi:hypothetical protein
VLNTFALQVDGVYSFFLLSLVELEHGIRIVLTYAYFPEDLSVKMKNKYLLPRFFSSETDCLFVIILHSAAGGHGITRTYFLPASSVT